MATDADKRGAREDYRVIRVGDVAGAAASPNAKRPARGAVIRVRIGEQQAPPSSTAGSRHKG